MGYHMDTRTSNSEELPEVTAVSVNHKPPPEHLNPKPIDLLVLL